ncbi:MAG: tetratricopeptide repeat protein [Deltaproteobacteria bacterium]|nr:tetratricopeptide repeat protein [Deltaproteobacteria bacterium]
MCFVYQIDIFNARLFLKKSCAVPNQQAQGQYEKAITAMKKVLIHNAHFLPARIFLASAYVRAGQKKEARAEVAELLKLNPSYSLAVVRETIPLKDQEKLDIILDSLREAGLK